VDLTGSATLDPAAPAAGAADELDEPADPDPTEET
jgi:hypothetical protein